MVAITKHQYSEPVPAEEITIMVLTTIVASSHSNTRSHDDRNAIHHADREIRVRINSNDHGKNERRDRIRRRPTNTTTISMTRGYEIIMITVVIRRIRRRTIEIMQ